MKKRKAKKLQKEAVYEIIDEPFKILTNEELEKLVAKMQESGRNWWGRD